MPSLTAEPATLTPYALVSPQHRPSARTKLELLQASRNLERRISTHARTGRVSTVLVTFQDKRHMTSASRDTYAGYARGGIQVFAYARGLISNYREASWELPVVSLAHEDPLAAEWDIVVLGEDLNVAFVARDLEPDVPVVGKDLARAFDWTTTSDPELVRAAAETMLARVPSR